MSPPNESHHGPGALAGRVVLVTGAGSGIGAASARLMAARGARVAVLDVDGAAAETVAGDIRAGGGEALALAADVACGEAQRDAVARTVDAFGTLDVAVANAGVQLHTRDVDLHSLPEEVWDRTHAVNYRGAYLTCRHALAHMVTRGSGVIVIVSSITALSGMTPNVSYASGKAGLLELNRHIAVHYGPRGIRSVAVCPGALEHTPDWRDHPDPDGRRERMTARIPLGRLGRPGDIAPAIAFLAGADSAWVNGAVLVIDGGMTVT